MTGLEDLFLILALKGHSIVDVVVLHIDLLDWLIHSHWVDVLLDYTVIFFLLSTRWVHHVWQVLLHGVHLRNVVWSDMSDL